MAFFKFRKGGEDHPTPTPAPESVEAMRKRAKHRLIGASLLVLMGVVGFPLLFDNQPRPIPVDLPIDIPDKNKVKPLGNLPVGGSAAAGAVAEVIIEESSPSTSTKGASGAGAEPVQPRHLNVTWLARGPWRAHIQHTYNHLVWLNHLA